jgi:hypothetical protein
MSTSVAAMKDVLSRLAAPGARGFVEIFAL